MSTSEKSLATDPMSTDEYPPVLETTNGSFQNQPPADHPCGRKRGISALLKDITNSRVQETRRSLTNSRVQETRRSAVRAKRSMVESQSHAYAPCGNPVQGGKCGGNKRRKSNDVKDYCTVHDHLLKIKDLPSDMHDYMAGFLQRNASYEVQKALAIHILLVAVHKWGYTVLEAAECASDCSGFNPRVIHRWASAYVDDVLSHMDEEIDDEYMTSILSSSRGQHTSHLESVVDDESFALAACSFVRTHACQKGQPNMAGKMFADWVKAEYSQVVHETTARRWLHHLGFNRIHHQKGVYFDGHDREDVVAYREEFLRMMDELDRKSLTCTGHVPTLSPGEKPLIRVAHDECTTVTKHSFGRTQIHMF